MKVIVPLDMMKLNKVKEDVRETDSFEFVSV